MGRRPWRIRPLACRGGKQFPGIGMLDHRADIFEDDIAARTLGQAVADLLANRNALVFRDRPRLFR